MIVGVGPSAKVATTVPLPPAADSPSLGTAAVTPLMLRDDEGAMDNADMLRSAVGARLEVMEMVPSIL